MRVSSTGLICSILLILIGLIHTQNVTDEISNQRNPKIFGLVNVVSFPNENCQGGSRNGTCYTAEECSNLGGNNDGTCASGFGVCCTFVLSCGQSSSQNCTYIEMAAFSETPTTNNPCIYRLTRSDDNVCRIRLDFQVFNIANPPSAEVADAAAPGTANLVGWLGDCIGDSFTASSPGADAPPVICGFNTGQHMILDTNGGEHVLSFFLRATAFSTRQWTIKATHYACGSTMGGPPGCLQYYTGTTGRVSSYNFDTTLTTIPATPRTHLSNQNYEICFRRGSGNCAFCLAQSITGTPGTPADMGSFGLSIAGGDGPNALVDSGCTADFIDFPGGVTATNGAIASPIVATAAARFCGRNLNIVNTAQVTITVCSRARPFRIRFVTDVDEVAIVTPASDATKNELDKSPGGTHGFSFNFNQIAC